MSKVKTKREFSAGGVLYRQIGNDIEVALAKRITERGKIVWCLPKGKIEKGEKPEDTALREVKEETGMEGKLIAKLDDINYWFYSQEEKVRIFKTVKFYLLKYLEGKPENHDWEMEEVVWVKLKDAENLASYPTEKEILKKARNYLTRKR